MIGLLFVALVVGPTTAVLMWGDGAAVALASASVSASLAVLAFSLVVAYLRLSKPRRQRFHERGEIRGHFGSSWHAVAHR
jgi:hypothetical protein